MRKSMVVRGLLLSAAMLAAPALAQTTDPEPAPAEPEPEAAAPAAATDEPARPEPEEIEVSVPGASLASDPDIVITGSRSRNIVRRAPEVLNILSSEDIERTGEGDIAGALQRITGLSVVGNGFVFVRGLGDRYSLALLNGSPLPSPEPLRRVVPLDIFPTSVVSSALVQKSYSVNYPGEFGGGVINLTTPTAPREPFLEIGGGVTFDTESSFQTGYAYYGSDLDYLGFDDGARDIPAPLLAAVSGGSFAATTGAERRDFAASLLNSPTTLIQRLGEVPASFSADISAGTSLPLGAARIGLIVSGGYSNSWRSRDALQQTSLDPGLAGIPQTDFRTVTTDNRIVVNGLAAIGLDVGEHRLRWTNLFIRDTLKQARVAAGSNRSVRDQNPGLPPTVNETNSYWFERQLIDTQLVGELRFGDFSVDLRGTFANTQRESPYERAFSYIYLGDGDPATRSESDVDDYINNLAGVGQSATVAFNDLNEDLWAGGIDLAYRIRGGVPITLSTGYAYSDTHRSSSRFQFRYFRPDGALPLALAQQRPDYLVSDFNVYNYGIELSDVSGAEGAASYEADLTIHGAYVQAEIEPVTGLRVTAGVRYEDAVQTVATISNAIAPTELANHYWLPAATVTWNIRDDLQLRLHGSRTIARPQFRELAPQIYQDFESDREFTGNPFLVDSRLTNAEGRLEYYFRPDQRITVAGFYKQIDNPIEAAAFFAGGGQLRTGFANASGAELYGAEIEAQAYLPLERLGGFFATRRLVLIGNYTYSQSRVSADATSIIGPDLQPVNADLLFEDGAPLTGQSDHLANLQIGIEDTDRLSQMTLALTYASERVTNRGPIQGLARQPDIIERPGIRLDFVLRQEARLLGLPLELKFEARNLLGTDYEEYQIAGDNRIDINSYRVGRSFSLGAKVSF